MTTFTHVFSLALLHFLWQGMAVAIALWIALLAMRKASANARYLVCCCALAVLMLLPAATACVLYELFVNVVGAVASSVANNVPQAATAGQPASSHGLAEFVSEFVSGLGRARLVLRCTSLFDAIGVGRETSLPHEAAGRACGRSPVRSRCENR